MINFWKTAILLATTVAAVHCLTCRQCPVSILDLCLFGSDITCNDATQSCYRGTAQFNSTGAIRLEIRGCLDSDLCGDVLTGNIFGNALQHLPICQSTNRGDMMNNVWKTAVLLAAIVAVAHCLTCLRCPVSAGDLCNLAEDIECPNPTDQCFRGTVGFGPDSDTCLLVTGCLPENLCGQTLTDDQLLFGNEVRAEFECCDTDRCNGATSVKLSIATAISAIIFSLWFM